MPDPARTGSFFTVELTGVKYAGIKHLEPSDRSESIGTATERVCTAIRVRGMKRTWK